MEHQKTLWIIFSVTLFLLVVVVVGFIWFMPPDADDASTPLAEAGVVQTNAPGSFDPIEWVRGTASVPGLSDSADDENDDLLLVIGDAAPAATSPAESTTGSTTSRPAAEIRVESTPATTRTATPAPSTPSTTAPARTTPAPAARTPAPAATASPAPAARVTVTDYWIQAGSFRSKSRAEEVRADLSEKGLTALITSVDVEDDTFFRVRIGPYATKDEAAKFLEWIRDVDNFGSSYISEVYTTRAAN
jgi:cell division septation protein DedD